MEPCKIRMLVAITLITAMAAACGSSPASPSRSAQGSAAGPTAARTADATAEASATPDGGPPTGDLAPGSYRAHFDPAFTFTLGPGWQRNIPDPELSDVHLQLLYAAGNGGELLFIEATDLGVEASLERFDQFRFKDVSPAAPATVGGVSGLAIAGGHPPTVAVVRGIPPGSDYQLAANDRIRATAVEVDGVTVTFIVEATDDDFDGFLLLADQVLRTVAFP